MPQQITKKEGAWLKQRLQQTDDFVVGGYIGTEGCLGELVVERTEDEGLLFVESVKNGFVPVTRTTTLAAIKDLNTEHCPFVSLSEKKDRLAWPARR